MIKRIKPGYNVKISSLKSKKHFCLYYSCLNAQDQVEGVVYPPFFIYHCITGSISFKSALFSGSLWACLLAKVQFGAGGSGGSTGGKQQQVCLQCESEEGRAIDKCGLLGNREETGVVFIRLLPKAV